MIARVASTAVLAALLAGAGSGVSGAAGDRVVTFQTPSKRIGCEYRRGAGQAEALRCDIADVADRPARPASCELDYGSAFGLTAKGRVRRLCTGDTIRDPKAKVLPYGSSRKLGPFTCVSKTTGLRCSTAAGHGFTLSRAQQKLF